ncbi:MAG: putative cupin superfamily sugar epimerase [Bacteriovoracaceae bacterium]|jgi:predicted cupin superfamily sugar epimerase
MNPEKIMKHFKMQKHPEGGAFLETYRSQSAQEFIGFNGERSISTNILFLLQKGEISAFHRIKSDETWSYHLGDQLEVIEIDLMGKLIRTVIGSDFLNGDKLQYTVAAGHWFASHTLGDYSLVGCSVSPGFDFRDFELANRKNLIQEFKNHAEIIGKFTY